MYTTEKCWTSCHERSKTWLKFGPIWLPPLSPWYYYEIIWEPRFWISSIATWTSVNINYNHDEQQFVVNVLTFSMYYYILSQQFAERVIKVFIFNYQLAFYLWSVNTAKGIAMMYYSFTWWWLTFKLVDSSKLYCVIKKCQVCSLFHFFLLLFNKWSPWCIKCPEIEYTSSSNLESQMLYDCLLCRPLTIIIFWMISEEMTYIEKKTLFFKKTKF